LILTQPPYRLPPEEGYELTSVSIGGNTNSANLEIVAHELFNSLRELDERNCHIILVQAVDDLGQGVAIMNRLRKAARFFVY